MKDRLLKTEGQVLEALPNGEFRVELSESTKEIPIIIRCYMNGKMRMNKIKILPGDKVKIELPPSVHMQNTVGRIVYRG